MTESVAPLINADEWESGRLKGHCLIQKKNRETRHRDRFSAPHVMLHLAAVHASVWSEEKATNASYTRSEHTAARPCSDLCGLQQLHAAAPRRRVGEADSHRVGMEPVYFHSVLRSLSPPSFLWLLRATFLQPHFPIPSFQALQCFLLNPTTPQSCASSPPSLVPLSLRPMSPQFCVP